MPKSGCPGVYVLAYDKELEGLPIKLKDIFYVGMSTARGGVRSRLRQFLRGLEVGKSHSGAKRFFRMWMRERPYSRSRTRERFFVAVKPVPCRVEKGEREPGDLRKMGGVARLEYYVLARVLQHVSHEPKLNKR